MIINIDDNILEFDNNFRLFVISSNYSNNLTPDYYINL